jgi:malonyl-CoA/methylmalonyl-CoA synthetase
LQEAWGFSPDDVLLHALPIFHVHGLFVALHCALLSGCPMVWLPKFADAEVLAGWTGRR